MRFFVVCLLFTATRATSAGQPSTIAGCGGTFDDDRYAIESPNYPRGYPSSVDCTYRLDGGVDECLREYTLQPLDFDLAIGSSASSGCAGDRIEIEDKDVLCGGRAVVAKTYTAVNGTLRLRFVADAHGSGRGFRFAVNRSPCKRLDDRNRTATSCCDRVYNARRFHLSSPYFPRATQPHDCVYRVTKAHRDVCRLRVHFLFFDHGAAQTDDGRCRDGAIAIDGQRLCGCRSGLKAIVPFARGSDAIAIAYATSATRRSNGFLLEIVQDECPRRVDLGESSAFEREQTTYYDTSTRHLPPREDPRCRRTLRLQYGLLDGSGLLRRAPRCPAAESSRRRRDCVELRHVKGYVVTVGYPFYYPPDAASCARITRRPGHCRVRLLMLDFHLEASADCAHDYVAIDGRAQRYCGASLTHTEHWFDLREKPSVDIDLVTDGRRCGRGFKAIYEQIPCDPHDRPPPTSPYPPYPPPVACKGETFAGRTFTLRATDPMATGCEFDVIKADAAICSLELNLSSFEVPCNGGRMLLDDGRRYCGNLSGQKLLVGFRAATIRIRFERSTEDGQRPWKAIVIDGNQVEEFGCSELPPAERIISGDDGNSNRTLPKTGGELTNGSH